MNVIGDEDSARVMLFIDQCKKTVMPLPLNSNGLFLCFFGFFLALFIIDKWIHFLAEKIVSF